MNFEAAALTFAGIAFLWLARVTVETRDGMRDLRAAIFGVNGDNGLNGTSKDHEKRIRSLEEGP